MFAFSVHLQILDLARPSQPKSSQWAFQQWPSPTSNDWSPILWEGQLVVKAKIKELADFINEEKFQADRIARLVGKQWKGVGCGMLEAKIKGQEMGY